MLLLSAGNINDISMAETLIQAAASTPAMTSSPDYLSSVLIAATYAYWLK